VEVRFWELVESAWAACGPEATRARRALVERDPAADGDDLYALDAWMDQFLAQLGQRCTDGSDDGFLYCRGFVVAVGRDFFDAVNANPAMAVLDAECAAMCYFFAHLHNRRFGKYPETGSGISRESVSNPDGW
jgi:hypothetical protein